MNLYAKTSLLFTPKCCSQFTKTKLKLRGKVASSEFSHKERQVLLTVHKLFEHFFWQNILKFYNKIHLTMKTIYNVNNVIELYNNVIKCYRIRLNFGDKFLTFSSQSVLKVKGIICSTIKENLLLDCRKF